MWIRLFLECIRAWDRWRLWRLARRHPGLEIDPTASTNFALAEFALGPGARLRIGPGATTERRPGGVRFALGAGAEVSIGEGSWLRSDVERVQLVAFDGAHIRVGPRCFLNGCSLSAKQAVEVGVGSMIGPGTRVYDADQHPTDADRPERIAPVCVGSDTWIASDCTVLRGAQIGDSCVVGARSVVTRPLPAHSLSVGIPAVPIGEVGDRSKIRCL